MTDETTLLPCPFCGGEAEVHPSSDWNTSFSGKTFFVWCDKCETRGDYYNTEAEATTAWNTRAYLNPDGLPNGLTISDDSNLLNWRGENYVKQGTLGNGTLTAEQVREAVEASTFAETSTIREFNDSSWQAIADEIEAEIAEKYMELPVDADGVPIHVGDMLECYANGYEGTFTVFAVGNKTVIGNHDIEWVGDNPDKWFHVASFCHHVKPLKLEELLNDYLKEREKIVRKMERSMITLGEGESEEDACDKLFAERIREMMKDDGE